MDSNSILKNVSILVKQVQNLLSGDMKGSYRQMEITRKCVIGLSLHLAFLGITFNFLNSFSGQRITDEGLVSRNACKVNIDNFIRLQMVYTSKQKYLF